MRILEVARASLRLKNIAGNTAYWQEAKKGVSGEGGQQMPENKPGPEPGSEGARKIAEAHRGSHEHDREGGFAANPELAKVAGKKGGEAVKSKYGSSFYREIGKKGGDTVKRERGPGFYAEIGKRGGEQRSAKLKKLKESDQQK